MVKKMIQLLHRRFAITKRRSKMFEAKDARPIIWNGHVKELNCLIDASNEPRQIPAGICPEFKDTVAETDPSNIEELDCQPVKPGGSAAGRLVGRAGGFCPLPLPDAPGGSGGSGRTVTFTSGPVATPTCLNPAGCGGHLCSGYYCSPKPTGMPPDFQDPRDPRGEQPMPTTSIGAPGGPSTGPIQVPTLTSKPDTGAPIPTDCASVSTWSTCIAPGGGNSACQTFSSCISTKVPTTTSKPTSEPTSDPVPTGPPTFYLYVVTTVTEDANPIAEAVAVSRKAKDFSENPGSNPIKHCEAVDNGTDLVDDTNRSIKPEYSYYPWYEETFKTFGGLCGKDLRFKRTGGDYDVFEGDKKVGVCVKASAQDINCFNWWSITVSQVYACTGAC